MEPNRPCLIDYYVWIFPFGFGLTIFSLLGSLWVATQEIGFYQLPERGAVPIVDDTIDRIISHWNNQELRFIY
jgi:hypothetical protein